jgi:hypothetical protein
MIGDASWIATSSDEFPLLDPPGTQIAWKVHRHPNERTDDSRSYGPESGGFPANQNVQKREYNRSGQCTKEEPEDYCCNECMVAWTLVDVRVIRMPIDESVLLHMSNSI